MFLLIDNDYDPPDRSGKQEGISWIYIVSAGFRFSTHLPWEHRNLTAGIIMQRTREAGTQDPLLFPPPGLHSKLLFINKPQHRGERWWE